MRKLIINLITASVLALTPAVAMVQAVSTVPATTGSTAVTAPSTASGHTCTDMQNRIAARINNWQTIKDSKVDRWQKMHDRFVDVYNKLKAKGYDVTKLQNDAVTLQGYIDAMKKDYDDVIAKANEAKAIACGDRDVFRATMQDLRNLIKGTAKPQWQQIRDFVKKTLKPDFLSYKNITQSPTVAPSVSQ